MKKLISVFLALIMAISLAACGAGSGSSSGNTSDNTSDNSGASASNTSVKTIKFADWYAEDHPQNQSIKLFKKLVEERSNGTIKVDIYPNSQLGSEDTFDDSVSQGTVEMGSAGTGIQKFSPKIAVTEAPFLFKDWQDAHDILTGEIGQKICDELVTEGNMRCLAITVNGFRQMSSNKPMYKISDFKGQKFRTPNIPHFIQMMDVLGATAVPMAMSEIFNALQEKVVDGQENPYPTIYTSSFYEVQKYVLESNHMFSPNFWIINNDFYEGLTDEQRNALDSSIAEAAANNWEISEKADEEAKQKIADAGTTIIIPDEAFEQQMQDAMGPVYQWFYKNKAGSEEIVNLIRDYQANHPTSASSSSSN